MVKYKVDWLNNGKEFNVPDMTVEIYEQATEKMLEYGKMEQGKYIRLLNKQLILTVLDNLGIKVTLKDLKNLHPDDYTELFEVIWTAGSSKKDDRKFRKPERKNDISINTVGKSEKS